MDKVKVTLSEIFYYLFFGLLLFAKGIGLYDGQTAFKLILVAAAIVWLGKMFLTSYTKKELTIVILLLGLGTITYLVSGEKGALLYILMVTGLKNIPIRRVFTLGAWVWGISFMGTAIFNAVHILEGPFKVHEKLGMGMIIRWGLGQSHPNILHISYLVLVMFVVYLLGERFNLKAAIGLMVGNILIFIFSVSSTGMITVTFYLGLSLYIHYRKNLNKLEYLLLQLIFPVILLYSFVAPLVLQGELFEKVNNLTNTRLNLAKYFLTLKGPSLFGNRVSDIITSQLTMDNAYVNAYVTYGIVLAVVIAGVYFMLIRKSCHNGRKGELAIILACLVAGIMEPFLFNTSFKNISLLFLGEILFTQKNEVELQFFCKYDREFQPGMERINRLAEGIAKTINEKKAKLLGICILFSFLGGAGYYLLWEKPAAIMVPEKDIDISILQQNPKLEPVYIDYTKEVPKEDVLVYGYKDSETGMIICDNKNLINLEGYRGILSGGVLTGTIAFACILAYDNRKRV